MIKSTIIILLYISISVYANGQLLYDYSISTKLDIEAESGTESILECFEFDYELDTFDLFICWGQSNFISYGGFNDSVTNDSSSFINYFSTCNYGLRFKSPSTIDTISIEKISFSGDNSKHNMALQFAIEYYGVYEKPAIFIGLVEGSTNMYNQWNPDSSDLFDNLFVTALGACEDYLNTNNINFNYAGILGFQGESDVLIPNYDYDLHFSKFIDSTYNYTTTNIPHVYARIHNGWEGVDQDDLDSIRNDQVYVSLIKENCEWVNIDDLGQYIPGNVHIDHFAIKTVGTRMFNTWKSIYDNL